MEIDPTGSIQEMIDNCTFQGFTCGLSMVPDQSPFRACSTADASGGGGAMSGLMQDLAFAIPGVDEAMGFAEVMK